MAMSDMFAFDAEALRNNLMAQFSQRSMRLGAVMRSGIVKRLLGAGSSGISSVKQLRSSPFIYICRSG
jgi:hypothetical protein